MSRIQKKFIVDDAIGGSKILLENNTFLRARNAANSTDINIFKVDAANKFLVSQDINFADGKQAVFYNTANTFFTAIKAHPTATTSVSLTLPQADGTAGQVLATDGAGNLSFVTAGGGGGANTTLSNLDATLDAVQINAHLHPNADNTLNIGKSGRAWAGVLCYTASAATSFNLGLGVGWFRTGQTSPSAVASTVALQVIGINTTLLINSGTTSSSLNPTGKILIETGNNSNVGGSGLIQLRTGSAAALRGKVIVDAAALQLSTVS